MIGHCGGLRPSQTIGDYVLAHAYLRDDHVLDDVLPPEIPLPVIAEVQKALFEATVMVTGEDEDSVKKRLRTGTVGTTADRNWSCAHFVGAALKTKAGRSQSTWRRRLAAQATIPSPYGTLLCVSDSRSTGIEDCRPGQCLL